MRDVTRGQHWLKVKGKKQVISFSLWIWPMETDLSGAIDTNLKACSAPINIFLTWFLKCIRTGQNTGIWRNIFWEICTVYDSVSAHKMLDLHVYMFMDFTNGSFVNQGRGRMSTDCFSCTDRIIEQFGLEGTPKLIQFRPSATGRDTLH